MPCSLAAHRLPILFPILAATLLAQPAPPRQPLPFSHKQHAATGLKCKECHQNADPGEMMGFPAASKCMACHVEIAKDKPAIQTLQQLATSRQPIPWVRVYQIPSYVAFSHRTHLEAGAGCEPCHGPVAQRDALWREGNISMGGCVACHRENRASTDCNLCHEPR
ncbi:MAG: cytochrome c3 family protein [Bryobacteraceae bacterium]